MSVTVPFVTRVVKDYTSGNIMKNEATLARDLRIVIEKLGPTFIKVRERGVRCAVCGVLTGPLYFLGVCSRAPGKHGSALFPNSLAAFSLAAFGVRSFLHLTQRNMHEQAVVENVEGL